MVCLDTNIVIDYLHGDKKTVETVAKMALSHGGKSLAITSITMYELFKSKKPKAEEALQGFVDDINLYNLDKDSALASARIFASLSEKGRMINENDILIAGIALANDDILITKDKHFESIENAKILII